MILLFVFVKILFIATKLKDPGYLKKANNVPFIRLVEKLNPNELCPKCTDESRHCFICDRCVEGFDHHCQWLDSCIGAK
jgi:Fe2+ or Zn2+ uptake regulation protein